MEHEWDKVEHLWNTGVGCESDAWLAASLLKASRLVCVLDCMGVS